MKKRNHDLPGVWVEFKAQFKDPALEQFDSIVSALHAFEELRYPDSVLVNGLLCTISIKRPSVSAGAGAPAVSPPQYDLCLEDIDNLVATIFTVVSVNPKFFTGGLKNVAKQWLNEENAETGLTSAGS